MKILFHKYICQQVGDNILKTLFQLNISPNTTQTNIFSNKFKLQYEYNTKCKASQSSIVWQNTKIHDKVSITCHTNFITYIFWMKWFFFSIQLKSTCFTIERVQIHNNFFDTNSNLGGNFGPKSSHFENQKKKNPKVAIFRGVASNKLPNNKRNPKVFYLPLWTSPIYTVAPWPFRHISVALNN
jgi:hypothetical protein